jgi:hypothetical protein
MARIQAFGGRVMAEGSIQRYMEGLQTKAEEVQGMLKKAPQVIPINLRQNLEEWKVQAEKLVSEIKINRPSQ